MGELPGRAGSISDSVDLKRSMLDCMCISCVLLTVITPLSN